MVKPKALLIFGVTESKALLGPRHRPLERAAGLSTPARPDRTETAGGQARFALQCCRTCSRAVEY